MGVPSLIVLLSGVATQMWADAALSTPEDLADQYFNIFPSGNRNAASHLWTSYVMERAVSMPAERFGRIFKGFCAVSGSVIPDDPHTMYKTTLPKVGGGKVTGVARHCCWPCICDMNEHVRVDTKTITLADGSHSFHFLVIGDPCAQPDLLDQPFTDPFSGMNASLSKAAPEVKCKGGKLVGATFSDHGHPIIGMFFTDPASLDAAPEAPHMQKEKESKDPTFGYGEMCSMRKTQGYNSGMGLIFHLVAKIAPIADTEKLPLPTPDPALAKKLISQVQSAPKVTAVANPPLPAAAPPRVLSGLALVSAPVVAVAGASIALRRHSRRGASSEAQASGEEVE